MRIFLFITYFALSISSILFANARADELTDVLSKAVLGQQLDLTAFVQLYDEQEQEFKRLDLTSQERFYYLAEREYWLARKYQSLPTVAAEIEYYKLNTQGDHKEASQLYPNKKIVIKHYENALQNIDAYLKNDKKNSKAYILFADIQGHLVLLKSLTYMLVNGLKVPNATQKAIDLDDNNIYALIMKSSAEIFTPALYGGNPPKGIKMAKEILTKSNLTEQDKFNIYATIAHAYMLEKKYNEVSPWLEKASAIYPQNKYVQALAIVLAEEKRSLAQ